MHVCRAEGLNNYRYTGIAEKCSNKYKLGLIENADVSIFLDIIRGVIHDISYKVLRTIYLNFRDANIA